MTYQMIENLLPYDADHVEALLIPHAVHDHVAVDAYELPAIQDGVLVLARGIDDLRCKILVLVADDFGKCVFDSGIVGVDKVTVNELDSQRALACERRVRPVFGRALNRASSVVKW